MPIHRNLSRSAAADYRETESEESEESEDEYGESSLLASAGKEVGEEFAPSVDIQRIGIELEGIGTVGVKWGKAKPKTTSDGFHQVFKRTPLVRSNSYDKGRGVYIVPEDTDPSSYGKLGPAELVSNPHALDKQGLNDLRASYKKAMVRNSSTNPMLKPQKAVLKDIRKSDDSTFNSKRYSATTRWGQSPLTKVGGSLQVTIGVEVDKLISDDKPTRIKVVEMLVGDATKRQKVRDLLLAAICIEQTLTADGRPFAAFRSRPQGVRLSVFMYLLNIFVDKAASSPNTWSKTTFGANFKGDSSFWGCGADSAKEALAAQLSSNPDLETQIVRDILEMMKREGLAQWVIDGIQQKKSLFSLSDVGNSGLSMQTDVEKWFSIPNFFYKEKLYTVVESREKNSGLNIKMAQFLNEELSADALLNELRSSGLVVR